MHTGRGGHRHGTPKANAETPKWYFALGGRPEKPSTVRRRIYSEASVRPGAGATGTLVQRTVTSKRGSKEWHWGGRHSARTEAAKGTRTVGLGSVNVSV